MRIKATKEQVAQMCALAVNASSPMGMGFLHYKPDHEFKASEFLDAPKKSGCFLDYVEGRMVKFRMWPDGEDVWEAPDEIRSDYESWICKYPSYRELAEAAGATVL